MHHSIRLFLLAAAVVFIGCEQKPKSIFDKIGPSALPEKYAQLSVSREIDMGVFDDGQLQKSTTLLLHNVGNDTLFIVSVMPECDCTEVTLLDSAIAPQSSGRVKASLDLSSYPADTIRKDFGIISNNYGERVTRVTLVGLRL